MDVARTNACEAAIGTTERERGVDPIPTATLAEIYLRQGHLDQAREIYARLVEQAPADQRIRRRLTEIENKLGRSDPAPEAEGSTIEWLESLLEQIRKERKHVLR